MGTTVVKKPIFFLSRIELLTNSTFNIPIRDEELRATPATFSTSYFPEDDSDSFPTYSSDDNFLPAPSRLSKIRHEPSRYGFVAQYIVLFSVLQSEIYKPLSYNIAMQLPEAYVWKQAMDKEVSSLYKNHM